jgi:hypothetical protein
VKNSAVWTKKDKKLQRKATKRKKKKEEGNEDPGNEMEATSEVPESIPDAPKDIAPITWIRDQFWEY